MSDPFFLQVNTRGGMSVNVQVAHTVFIRHTPITYSRLPPQPVVFFSILDHHSRRPAAAPSTNKVMGCIMGTVSKDGVVEITNRLFPLFIFHPCCCSSLSAFQPALTPRISFALPVAALTKVDDADEYLRSMKRMHECAPACLLAVTSL